ncbi:MAG: DUF995 domain-containing protein [Actinobacteria bacterium]|nr:DUF995 domain-containing protein [Actinomycetota bacterium]
MERRSRVVGRRRCNRAHVVGWGRWRLEGNGRLCTALKWGSDRDGDGSPHVG